MISDVNGAIYYHRNVYETLKAEPRSVRVFGSCLASRTLIDHCEWKLGYLYITSLAIVFSIRFLHTVNS